MGQKRVPEQPWKTYRQHDKILWLVGLNFLTHNQRTNCLTHCDDEDPSHAPSSRLGNANRLESYELFPSHSMSCICQPGKSLQGTQTYIQYSNSNIICIISLENIFLEFNVIQPQTIGCFSWQTILKSDRSSAVAPASCKPSLPVAGWLNAPASSNPTMGCSFQTYVFDLWRRHERINQVVYCEPIGGILG